MIAITCHTTEFNLHTKKKVFVLLFYITLSIHFNNDLRIFSVNNDLRIFSVCSPIFFSVALRVSDFEYSAVSLIIVKNGYMV